MITENKTTEIDKKMFKVQQEIENLIAKDKKGYGYNFTSFGFIFNSIKIALNNNNLLIKQTVFNTTLESVGVETTITDLDSSQYITFKLESKITPLAKMNHYQVMGSMITYFRRYHLQTIFNLIGEDNIDAEVALKKQEKTISINELKRDIEDLPEEVYNNFKVFMVEKYKTFNLENLSEKDLVEVSVMIKNKKNKIEVESLLKNKKGK